MCNRLTVFLLILLAASTLLASVPPTLSYQGRLTDNGVPVNGLQSVMFTIYDGSGTPVWNSGIAHVIFAAGLFTVELGQSPQPPLPIEIWPADTAMSLGVTISPNPELSPRLRFKTTPYAMHALTAERANSGAGWLRDNGLLFLEDQADSIGVGTTTPNAKVGISAIGNQTALRLETENIDYRYPTLVVECSDSATGAIFRRGDFWFTPKGTVPTIFATNRNSNGLTAWMENTSEFPALFINSSQSAAIDATSWGDNYGLVSTSAKGILSRSIGASAIRAECNPFNDDVATVLSSAYTGEAVRDHIAVSGYARPTDYYGVGGRFEGGFEGILGVVYPDLSGTHAYYGVSGEVSGGSGLNFGVRGYASGAGTNYGVHGAAEFGELNWAGYFDGNLRVTGGFFNGKSAVTIDHPSDPDNKFLQQAEVVSNGLKAVYDGTVVLGSDGSAVVQLPDWLESFCGDFRYQLTCIGGYAPVYVSSKIVNARFAIAGGTPGLEVSWQVTGIRKDKFAQANPLEVEKKKTASEQGKYLHPELLGYGADRSLSPRPETNASVKTKGDAIRAASAALGTPSPRPQRPQFKTE